eukprot:360184-Chlamydomonas_euryale.AAC.7
MFSTGVYCAKQAAVTPGVHCAKQAAVIPGVHCAKQAAVIPGMTSCARRGSGGAAATTHTCGGHTKR